MDFELRKTTGRRRIIRGLVGTAMVAVPLAASARTVLASGTLASGTLASTIASSASATSTFARESTMSQSTNPSAPTIVLVHGAFADSSSWNQILPSLLDQGFPVIAAANPLRGLQIDADFVGSLLKTIDGPIVLVGHSYGGSVITSAASQVSNVVALVFISGTAPDTGESTGDMTNRFPGSTLGDKLTMVPLPDGGTDLYLQQDKFWAQFCADLPEADARLNAVGQRPFTTLAVNEALAGEPAWKTIPSRFIYGELDKNIPAAGHAFMAKRAGSVETVEVKGSSHVVMQSHPDAVLQMIENAVLASVPAAAAA